MTVCEVTNKPLVSLLRLELDEGEAEAIALSCEGSAEPILLDEKNARRIAQRLGLAVLGTVGILIWAKRAGLIPNLREQLDALQSQGKFRLSQSVRQQVRLGSSKRESSCQPERCDRYMKAMTGL